MKDMTIKEIAEVSCSTEKTVRGWIVKASVKLPNLSGKTTEARRTGVAATFTLEEVIAIVRAGGNHTLADLLLENAKKTAHTEAQILAVKSRLNGKQMDVYLRAALNGVISKEEFKVAVGLKAAAPDPQPVYSTDLVVPDRQPARVESALRPVINRFSPTVQRTMLGAGYAAAKREESKTVQWEKNGKLFGDEAQS